MIDEEKFTAAVRDYIRYNLNLHVRVYVNDNRVQVNVKIKDLNGQILLEDEDSDSLPLEAV